MLSNERVVVKNTNEIYRHFNNQTSATEIAVEHFDGVSWQPLTTWGTYPSLTPADPNAFNRTLMVEVNSLTLRNSGELVIGYKAAQEVCAATYENGAWTAWNDSAYTHCVSNSTADQYSGKVGGTDDCV